MPVYFARSFASAGSCLRNVTSCVSAPHRRRAREKGKKERRAVTEPTPPRPTVRSTLARKMQAAGNPRARAAVRACRPGIAALEHRVKINLGGFWAPHRAGAGGKRLGEASPWPGDADEKKANSVAQGAGSGHMLNAPLPEALPKDETPRGYTRGDP